MQSNFHLLSETQGFFKFLNHTSFFKIWEMTYDSGICKCVGSQGKSQDASLRKAECLMVAQENAGCPQVHHSLIACSGGRTDN